MTVMSDAVPPPVVQAVLQAVMEAGAAPTVDCPAETPAAVTVTDAVCVMATPLIVAEIVLASAVVELKVDVDTPLAFVVVGDVKLLLEPVELSTTVAP